MAEAVYSPVTAGPQGSARVQLGDDHPGVNDPVYRARRDTLAAMALSWQEGMALPAPDYSRQEQEVWATVAIELERLHEQHACSAFLDGKAALALPNDRVPQLEEVGSWLEPISGFRYLPVAGLAPLRDFYGSFARGVFWSTQYLRHPSAPLYTPEPDLVHEVMGHANQLAHREFADLYRMVGRAVEKVHTDAALRFLSQVFWFTFEFGVVYERRRLRAYGAGILSSVGETRSFAGAEVRPVDFVEMGSASYDITRLQPVLYYFESPGQLQDELAALLDTYDDERYEAMVAGAADARPAHPTKGDRLSRC